MDNEDLNYIKDDEISEEDSEEVTDKNDDELENYADERVEEDTSLLNDNVNDSSYNLGNNYKNFSNPSKMFNKKNVNFKEIEEDYKNRKMLSNCILILAFILCVLILWFALK